MDNVFPQEIIDAGTGFNHKIRQKILSNLILKNELTYSEIKKIADTNNGNLNHHLHLLQKGSLIGKYVKKIKQDKTQSYYKITDFGKSFLNGMMTPINVETTQRRINRQTEEIEKQLEKVLEFRRTATAVRRSDEEHIQQIGTMS